MRTGYPEIFASLPVISHQQNLWSFAKPQSWWRPKNRAKSFLRRQVAKIALRKSKANIFISDFLRSAANEMVPKTAEKNFTIHNAISSEDQVNRLSGDNAVARIPIILRWHLPCCVAIHIYQYWCFVTYCGTTIDIDSSLSSKNIFPTYPNIFIGICGLTRQ